MCEGRVNLINKIIKMNPCATKNDYYTKPIKQIQLDYIMTP